jgi:hypothetical protein
MTAADILVVWRVRGRDWRVSDGMFSRRSPVSQLAIQQQCWMGAGLRPVVQRNFKAIGLIL